jgi:hypothetical protein
MKGDAVKVRIGISALVRGVFVSHELSDVEFGIVQQNWLLVRHSQEKS